jgi:hypothetical protein
MASQTVARMFGGSPIAVVGRLVLLSILVGIVVQTVGLDPMNIIQSMEIVARQGYAIAVEGARHAWQYFLLGAAIVAPLWVVVRLVRSVR